MDKPRQRLLALLREQPFITQDALAAQLGLARSTLTHQLAQLTREGLILGRAYVLAEPRQLLCIGAANRDRKLRTQGPARLASSNPASQLESAGGVARNIAENLARLGLPVQLLTAVGQDPAGQALLAEAASLGIRTHGSLQLAEVPTGSYTAVLDEHGDLLIGLAQMQACEALDAAFLQSTLALRRSASWTVLDLNLPAATVAALLAEAAAGQRQQAAVAASVPKMDRLPQDLRGLSLLLLNRDELAACTSIHLDSEAALDEAWSQLQARGLQRLVLTQGSDDVRCACTGEPLRRVPAQAVTDIVEVTGAGDAFAAGVVAGLLRAPHDLIAACRLGQRLAALTLQSAATVSPLLSPALLEETAP
ncbi:PfkB family carbohydrate kinase [Roseateles sp. DB2]|uniref:carbohydrate kinase family protein n=1 Tax=Roseateles sp. DB2 TaxID=3453717 RepID=UPI003EECA3F3